MILNENSVYKGVTVRLDGNHFRACTFQDCRLEFGGSDLVGMVECSFTDCVWAFVGPAANTLSFLSALYRGLGPEGAQLVERTFENIRSVHVTQTGLR
jgi:hypothetical protein